MLVRISKDWDFPHIMRQTPLSSNRWGEIEFTTEDINECDLLIVLNRPHDDIKIKAREVWIMSQESPVTIYKWHTDSFKYFDKVFSFWDKKYGKNIISIQTALPWHIGKNYDELKAINTEDLSYKKDRVSWVTSNASHKPGHKLRMNFKNFLQEQNFDFDLFGRGFNQIEDKFNGIFPFKYSIAIENDACDDYWTEKIADCFLSYSVPIYFGAKKITKYFPKESMILINPENPQESLDIINASLSENYWQKNFEALQEARNLVLEKYQFFPCVSDMIEKYNIKEQKMKHYYIPSNNPAILKRFKEKFKNNRKIFKANIRNFFNV